MIVKEEAAEQFAFKCGKCGHTWTDDYQTQHVEDGYGHEHDYYFHDGLPSLNPLTAGLICPSCRRASVSARLVSSRAVPSVEAAGAEPASARRRPVDPSTTETWLRVVTYRAEEPTEAMSEYMRASARGVARMMEGMKGFQAGYWGEDPTNGTVSAVTYWDSLEAIEAAAPSLSRLQGERARHGVNVQTTTNIRLHEPT